MSIEWFDQDFRYFIKIKKNVVEFSKSAALKFGTAPVLFGIDKEKRTITVKKVDRGGHVINSNRCINRICSTDLSRWLVNNGLEYTKYAAEWNDDETLTVRY